MSRSDIENTLGYTLHHLAFNMKSVLKLVFKHSGTKITPEAYFLLNLIPPSGIEQQTLVQKTAKDKAAITRLLDNLNLEGLIVRRVVTHNKRKSEIKISEKGLLVRDALNQALADISQPMLEGLSPFEREKLYQGLSKLNENLQKISDKLK